MNKEKRLKDPIYGYINIPNRYMNNVIDTAVFQRLRRIIQTSYSPLYSSAIHNRFVHSLGVYHLGRLAFDCLKEDNRTPSLVNDTTLDEIGDVFKLACLLHDVGHAPFSHTGEVFYLDENGEYDEIHKQLKEYVDDPYFNEPSVKNDFASAHEIMSATVGIKEFSRLLPNDTPANRSFFARCITGYLYNNDCPENSLRNCFISLLNSKIIDVDKLDYLIRDAFITGFDTVHIDYERLLSSLRIIKNDSGFYRLVYHKSAISVIENVVYARDAERKWIQNHPVVVYDGYLLYHMIRHLNENLYCPGCCDSRLFSLESLSVEGAKFRDGIKLRLISDDDIIYLSKNVYSFPLSEEYFNRSNRRHPAWKSEAEYKATFLRNIQGGAVLEKFEKTMEMISEYLKKNSTSGVINADLIKNIENDIPSEQDINQSDGANKKMFKDQIQKKTMMLRILNKLKKYAESKNIPFDFVILMESQFTSGFGEPDFTKIDVFFPSFSIEPTRKFTEAVSSLEVKEVQRNKLFYLFYKRNNGQPLELDCEELSLELYGACI